MSLKQLRLAKKYSQHQLARITKISQNAISQHERGIVDPTYSALKKYSQALDCEISDLSEMRTCDTCGLDLPLVCYYNRKQYHDTTCGVCRGDRVVVRSAKTRPFSDLEGLCYQMDKRRGERRGRTKEQIARSIAREHNRDVEFVRGKMDGLETL